MFYISKVTPLLFILAFINLFVSLYLKISSDNYIQTGLIAVFGFLGIVIISAMYQIIPNSQQEKLKYEFISYIVFLLLVLFSIFIKINQFIASLLFFVAVILFLFNIFPIIKVVKPITIRYLAVALVYLFFSSLFFD